MVHDIRSREGLTRQLGNEGGITYARRLRHYATTPLPMTTQKIAQFWADISTRFAKMMANEQASRATTYTIDSLLSLVPEHSSTVLARLREQPSLASVKDEHGYSLLHAASSYGQQELARALVKDFGVSPNIVDEDGETPLFAAETVLVARLLVEELGIDINHENNDGVTAGQKILADEEFDDVANYLKKNSAAIIVAAGERGIVLDNIQNGLSDAQQRPAESCNDIFDTTRRPPPVPHGMTMSLQEVNEADLHSPDPYFRSRIEALASSPSLDRPGGQDRLRELVSDIITTINDDGQRQTKIQRRL